MGKTRTIVMEAGLERLALGLWRPAELECRIWGACKLFLLFTFATITTKPHGAETSPNLRPRRRGA